MNKILSLHQHTKVMKNLPYIENMRLRAIATGTMILLFMLFTNFSMAQDQGLVTKITKALQSDDAASLSENFNASIELTLPQNEDTYSKKQAEQILKVFFKNNPVKTFSLEHSGNSNDGSSYIIGSHKTTTGKNFRVYILIKKRNDVDLIQQLQFEEE